MILRNHKLRVVCFAVIILVTVFLVSNLIPVFAQKTFEGDPITLSVLQPAPPGFSLVFIVTDSTGEVVHISPSLIDTNTYIFPLALGSGEYSVLAVIIDPPEYPTFKAALQGANIYNQNIKNILEQGVTEGSWSRFASKEFSVVSEKDVCLNIDGNQSFVPKFLVLDAKGDCVCPKSLDCDLVNANIFDLKACFGYIDVDQQGQPVLVLGELQNAVDVAVDQGIIGAGIVYIQLDLLCDGKPDPGNLELDTICPNLPSDVADYICKSGLNLDQINTEIEECVQ